MTTVINNPGGASGEGSGAGMVLGVIIGIILIGLFVIYGLPAIRGNKAAEDGSIDVNLNLPTGNPSPSPSPAPY